MTNRWPGPFDADSPADFSGLLQSLDSIGFTRANLSELGLLGRENLPRAKVALKSVGVDRRLIALIELFMLAGGVDRDRALDALGERLVSALVAMNVLVSQGNTLRSQACILPLNDRLTIRDFEPFETGKPMLIDHVPSISTSTALVSEMTVRTPCRRALDLGCGSAYHALLASAHAAEVVATDINSRCLNFAAACMRLNGVTNVNLRQGSLLEPVRGETFDLIACNPPFVISPGTELIFRDAGLRGDQVSETLLSSFAEMLSGDGWCTVLFNWHHKNDNLWPARPLTWVEGKGVDAWLIRLRTDDPESYARAWIKTGDPEAPVDEDKLQRWIAYLESIGAEAVSLGLIVLHKRVQADIPNWSRVDSPLEQERMINGSGQIRRVFAGETQWRAGGGDQCVLPLRLRLAPQSVLDQTSSAQNGAWTPTKTTLRQTHGLEHRRKIDPVVAAFLARCDGSRTVAQLIAEFAPTIGTTPDQMQAGVCAVLSRLYRDGYFDAV